ncbi:hypothetical protein ACU686_16780 [Yinghuangia aomiensis]
MGVVVDRRHPVEWEGLGLDLPGDYRRVVEEFPCGWFMGFASLHFPNTDPAWSHFDLIGRARESRELLMELREEGLAVPYAVHPEPGGLLQWGSSRWGNSLFWLTSGDDPELWTVVVTDSEFSAWAEFDGGLSNFLSALARGDFRPPFFTHDVEFTERQWLPFDFDVWTAPSPDV